MMQILFTNTLKGLQESKRCNTSSFYTLHCCGVVVTPQVSVGTVEELINYIISLRNGELSVTKIILY